MNVRAKIIFEKKETNFIESYQFAKNLLIIHEFVGTTNFQNHELGGLPVVSKHKTAVHPSEKCRTSNDNKKANVRAGTPAEVSTYRYPRSQTGFCVLLFCSSTWVIDRYSPLPTRGKLRAHGSYI